MRDPRTRPGKPADVPQRTDEALFRRRAAAAMRERWFGPVRVMVPPAASLTLGIAAITVVMLAAALVTIEIPDRVRAVGVLLPVDGLLKIRASRQGLVEHLVVANGDTVVAGQVLLRLSASHRAPGQEPEVAARIASLRRELALIEATLERELDTVRALSAFNQRRLELTRERIVAAGKELQTRQQQAELFAGRASRIERLVESRVAADHAADEAAAAALQSVAASQSARQRMLDLQDELVMIEQSLAADRTLPEVLRRDADLRYEEVSRQIAAGELQSAIELTAPDDGIISGLAVRPGDQVRPGQVLMTLHDPASRIEARLFLGPDSAAMITAGQRVELQLSAFPHQFYGTRNATVRSVSRTAVLAEEIDPGLSVSGPVFVVRADLRDDVIRVRGRSWPLAPGTSLTADLVRRRWPLYRWLLRSVAGDPRES